MCLTDTELGMTPEKNAGSFHQWHVRAELVYGHPLQHFKNEDTLLVRYHQNLYKENILDSFESPLMCRLQYLIHYKAPEESEYLLVLFIMLFVKYHQSFQLKSL